MPDQVLAGWQICDNDKDPAEVKSFAIEDVRGLNFTLGKDAHGNPIIMMCFIGVKNGRYAQTSQMPLESHSIGVRFEHPALEEVKP